jgi:parallel beta-helix repeat protein
MLLLGTSAHADAATYYVALTGSDSNTCPSAQNTSRPKQTIAAGVTCLNPGDTLYVRGGTYTGSSNVIDSARFTVPSGTSWSSAITIAGHPGETVVIQPPNNIHGLRLTTGAPSYLIFQDFTLDYSNDTAIPGANIGREGIYLSSGASHNRFHRLTVQYVKSFGIAFGKTSGHNEVLDCTVRYTGDGTGDIKNGHAMYISSSDNLIAGNTTYANEGYGIDLYDNAGDKTVARNIVRGNRIFSNGLSHSSAYGIAVAWGADNLIYNNLVYGNKGGILVYLESENTGVFNNTVVGNAAEGIAMQYYRSAPAVRNNIVYNNGGSIVDYAGGPSPNAPVTSHNLTSNPLFADIASNDFRLQVRSAARDAGVVIPDVQYDYEGLPRPQGGAYDVGAFEYAAQDAGPIVPPAPPTNIRLLH